MIVDAQCSPAARNLVRVFFMRFKQPVSVGDVVSFFAEVVSIGRTSITVRVEVYAERHPAQPITVKVTEAVLTYVAVNQQGGEARAAKCRISEDFSGQSS